MRSTLTLLAVLAAAPITAQSGRGMAIQMAAAQSNEMQTSYQALRAGEIHSAAFLAEPRSMPFGQVLGPVAQPAVPARQSPEMATPGMTIGVLPPAGVTYQRGDTIVLAMVMPTQKGWGEMIVPSGLALVGASTPRQTEAVVISIYGPIRAGQVTYPMAPIPGPANRKPVKAEGPTGTFLFGRDEGNPRQLGSELFVDLGSAAGVQLGDFIEFRRHPGPRANGADTIDERLAVGQVVHLSEKSSTVRIYQIADPTVLSGSPVVRVATLSN